MNTLICGNTENTKLCVDLSGNKLRSVSPEDISISGELAYRCMLNYNRLEKDEYRPERLLFDDPHGWPGDKPGRTIIALTRLAKAIGREPIFLDEIMRILPSVLNEKGYFGSIPEEGKVNEQQIGCHGWLLRGIVEYFNWKKDSRIYSMIEKIVRELLIPAREHYANYPIELSQRLESENWLLSSYEPALEKTETDIVEHVMVDGCCDTGCAFIMLDGAVCAYEILKWPELKDCIETIIKRFSQIDLIAIKAQTHATLSALRGIIRYYEIENRAADLELAKAVYNTYITSGITENYANYNWFEKPIWTEPCAVIDSYMAAVGLWKNTKDFSYIEDAHNIYYNAIMHSQRANGGFGTDTCLSDAERDIYMLCYDASWCCTMRGGDGLASAVEYNYFYDNDGFYLPFYNNSNVALKFDDGQVHIIQKTQYPCDGNVQLEVVSSSLKSEKNVCFYIPSWVKSDALKVTLNDIAIPFKREHLSLNFRYFPKAGDLIIISFEISLMQQETINAKHGDSFITLRHGSLILGQKKSLNEEINPNDEFVYQGYGRYISKSSGIVIRPIGDIDDPTAENKGFKALFKR